MRQSLALAAAGSGQAAGGMPPCAKDMRHLASFIPITKDDDAATTIDAWPGLEPAVDDEAGKMAHEILSRMGVSYTLKNKNLHTLVTAMVKNHRPMKLVDVADLPDVRELSLTTVYRLAAKLDECRMLRRLGSGDARAFSYMLLIPGRLKHYLTCTVSSPRPTAPSAASSPASAARRMWASLLPSSIQHFLTTDCAD